MRQWICLIWFNLKVLVELRRMIGTCEVISIIWICCDCVSMEYRWVRTFFVGTSFYRNCNGHMPRQLVDNLVNNNQQTSILQCLICIFIPINYCVSFFSFNFTCFCSPPHVSSVSHQCLCCGSFLIVSQLLCVSHYRSSLRPLKYILYIYRCIYIYIYS